MSPVLLLLAVFWSAPTVGICSYLAMSVVCKLANFFFDVRCGVLSVCS